MSKRNVFTSNCYLCNKLIYGIVTRFGGVFYKDSTRGEFHKKTCSSRIFSDAEQNFYNNGRYKTGNILNDNYQSSLFVENKISRICWNNNCWRSPSGNFGKSLNPKSFEHIYGYGNEEWLFDLEKLTSNGFHHSFLQSISTKAGKHIGKTYNITLYANNSFSNVYYWIGELKNVEVIDDIISTKVLEEYLKNGWIEELRNDVKKNNGDIQEFERRVSDKSIFNIRFKPKDVVLFESFIPFKDNEIIDNARYVLLNKEDYNFDYKKIFDFSLEDEEKDINDKEVVKFYNYASIEYKNIHNKIQKSFYKFLKKLYPSDKIQPEVNKNRNRIDILRETSTGMNIIYEIKAYPSSLQSLRIGLGQLLEYAYYPNFDLATKIVLVTHLPAESNTCKYLNYINQRFSIPLEYIQFDYENHRILQEINCN